MSNSYWRVSGRKKPINFDAVRFEPQNFAKKLTNLFMKENKQDRLSFSRLSKYRQILIAEIEIFQKAKKQHIKHAIEQSSEFDERESKFTCKGQQKLLIPFRMQTKVLDKYNNEEFQEKVLNPDQLVQNNYEMSLLNQRLEIIDAMCISTNKRFKLLEVEVNKNLEYSRQILLLDILSRYEKLPTMDDLQHIESNLSWDKFCDWYSDRHRKMYEIEQEFYSFVEDQREKEGRLLFRFCSSLLIADTQTMLSNINTDNSRAALAVASVTSLNRDLTHGQFNHDANDPSRKINLQTSASTSSMGSLENQSKDANGVAATKAMEALAAFVVTPATIKAFIKYFAFDVLGVTYHIPREYLAANLSLSESLIYRKMSPLLLRYKDKREKDRDEEWRIQCQLCRFVNPKSYHVPELYSKCEEPSTENKVSNAEATAFIDPTTQKESKASTSSLLTPLISKNISKRLSSSGKFILEVDEMEVIGSDLIEVQKLGPDNQSPIQYVEDYFSANGESSPNHSEASSPSIRSIQPQRVNERGSPFLMVQEQGSVKRDVGQQMRSSRRLTSSKKNSNKNIGSPSDWDTRKQKSPSTNPIRFLSCGCRPIPIPSNSEVLSVDSSSQPATPNSSQDVLPICEVCSHFQTTKRFQTVPSFNAGQYGQGYSRSSRVLSYLATSMTPREIVFNLALACRWVLRDAIDVSGSRGVIGADLFIPLFTMVLINAQIPNMYMILKFLLDYGQFEDQGDTSYNVANLEGSVYFISSLEIPVELRQQIENFESEVTDVPEGMPFKSSAQKTNTVVKSIRASRRFVDMCEKAEKEEFQSTITAQIQRSSTESMLSGNFLIGNVIKSPDNLMSSPLQDGFQNRRGHRSVSSSTKGSSYQSAPLLDLLAKEGSDSNEVLIKESEKVSASKKFGVVDSSPLKDTEHIKEFPEDKTITSETSPTLAQLLNQKDDVIDFSTSYAEFAVRSQSPKPGAVPHPSIRHETNIVEDKISMTRLGEWLRDQQTMEDTISILQKEGWMA